ncbi:YpiF family protein [Salipaludibacillus daqingensis]|uniref:YpiF family protein n=1 Tax=Salipaludibacillus daqingensis TaxID=3041001 RepID=UPI002475004B|nr:YpiF family protein [Salipaludibacillus daqingensis]
MKWKVTDIDTYQQAKEYVDTAVIPLIPLQWGKSEKETITMGEFTEYITDRIENQFTGRVFLMPPFTYLKTESSEEKLRRLMEWDAHLFQQGFKYVFYVTSDVAWKSLDKKLPDELIWIPAISSETMNSDQLKKTVEQQTSQIMPLFTGKWQTEPNNRDE